MKKPTPRERRAFGEEQEKIAAKYLVSEGLQLIAMNYQCKLGEIDLIMRTRRELVFVEVRYRRSMAFGTAAESVDSRKQRKLLRTAQYYLKTLNLTNHIPCRFDVLGLSPGVTAQEFHFDWIQHAFHL